MSRLNVIVISHPDLLTVPPEQLEVSSPEQPAVSPMESTPELVVTPPDQPMVLSPDSYMIISPGDGAEHTEPYINGHTEPYTNGNIEPYIGDNTEPFIDDNTEAFIDDITERDITEPYINGNTEPHVNGDLDDPQFEIGVIHWDGWMFRWIVRSSWTVTYVKNKLGDHIGENTNDFHLYYKGNRLFDTQNIGDAGLAPEDYVVIRKAEPYYVMSELQHWQQVFVMEEDAVERYSDRLLAHQWEWIRRGKPYMWISQLPDADRERAEAELRLLDT